MKSFTSRPFARCMLSFQILCDFKLDELINCSKSTPPHPGLKFKKVNKEENIYSVTIGVGYRALGQMDGAEIVWFWIGSHEEYNKIV